MGFMFLKMMSIPTAEMQKDHSCICLQLTRYGDSSMYELRGREIEKGTPDLRDITTHCVGHHGEPTKTTGRPSQVRKHRLTRHFSTKNPGQIL